MWKYLDEALSRPKEIIPDIRFYSILVDTAVLEEDRKKIVDYLPWFEKEAKRHDHKLFQAVALRAKAVAARLEGKYKPAQEHLEQARTIFQEMDTRWQLGRTHMEFGRVYRAQDDHIHAKEHFQKAADYFAALDARPDRERAQAEMISPPS